MTSTEQSWAIIANPVAGRGKARRLAPALQEALSQAGVSVTLAWTRGRGDGQPLARQALEGGATRLVVCGGDGTVHEVINGLMAYGGATGRCALGIVPLGRCNDLATALGFRRPVEPVAHALLGAKLRSIDLGCIGGHYFSTVATLGFDSVVAQYVDEGRPPRFIKGTLAYLYGVMIQLFRYRDVPVVLRDDGEEFRGALFMAATGNSSTYGGRLKVVPAALMDDGLLDVCRVPSVSRWEVLRVMPRVFSGTHVSHPAVSIRRTRRLEIQAETPLWVWADGEPITQTPTTIEVVPGALTVLVPLGVGDPGRQ